MRDITALPARLALAVLLTLLTSGEAGSATLDAPTASAWSRYVEATERRIDRELASSGTFLAQDFEPTATEARRRVLAGDVVVANLHTTNGAGEPIEVPGGLIHHWRGAIFIPGVTVDDLLDRVVNPGSGDLAQEDVLESRVLGRGPDSLRLFLKLQREKFVTVTYNTEHAVRYARYGDGRASSRSVATKIAELEAAGTPHEREKPAGEDRGFLWRLNSYWRYQQVEGGVIVECESLSLSRTIPGFIRAIVQPMIDSTARGSMERTLTSMRQRYPEGPGRST